MDAITNTSDETLTECNVVSERIMQGAGPDLKEEIITRGLGKRVIGKINDLTHARVRTARLVLHSHTRSHTRENDF